MSPGVKYFWCRNSSQYFFLCFVHFDQAQLDETCLNRKLTMVLLHTGMHKLTFTFFGGWGRGEVLFLIERTLAALMITFPAVGGLMETYCVDTTARDHNDSRTFTCYCGGCCYKFKLMESGSALRAKPSLHLEMFQICVYKFRGYSDWTQ